MTRPTPTGKQEPISDRRDNHRSHLPKDGEILRPSLSLTLKTRSKIVCDFSKDTSAVEALGKHLQNQQSHSLPQMPKQSKEMAG